jgi:hypothetical protein
MTEASIALELIESLRRLMYDWNLDSVRVGVCVQDGHTMFLSLARGAAVTLEREDGHSIALELTA